MRQDEGDIAAFGITILLNLFATIKNAENKKINTFTLFHFKILKAENLNGGRKPNHR